MPRGVVLGCTVLLLVVAGPFFSDGWPGHGLYKAALLLLPFAAGYRPRRVGRSALAESLRGAATGLALGALGWGLLSLLLPYFIEPAALCARFDARYHYDSAGKVVLVVGCLMTANAALEEWFYRGFLDAEVGPAVSAVFFGAQHALVLWGLAGPVPALLAGVATGVAGRLFSFHAARGGLAAAFVCHAAADAVLLGGGLFTLGYLP